MKKLAFLFATVVAVSFASCGPKAEQATEEVVEEATVTEEVECLDTCACDTCVCDTCKCAEAVECPEAE